MNHLLHLGISAAAISLALAGSASAMAQDGPSTVTPSAIPQPTAAETPVPRTPTGPATILVPVRVVYDRNSNGALDEDDTPLAKSFVGFIPRGPDEAARVGGDARTDMAGQSQLSVPAGTYEVWANGPRYLPEEEGKEGAICRGWDVSFVLGAPQSATASESEARLGVVVDIVSLSSEESKAAEVTIGVTDRMPDGTQILCPGLGGPGASASQLPATGSVAGASDRWSAVRRAAIVGSSAAFGVFAVLALATRISARR